MQTCFSSAIPILFIVFTYKDTSWKAQFVCARMCACVEDSHVNACVHVHASGGQCESMSLHINTCTHSGLRMCIVGFAAFENWIHPVPLLFAWVIVWLPFQCECAALLQFATVCPWATQSQVLCPNQLSPRASSTKGPLIHLPHWAIYHWDIRGSVLHLLSVDRRDCIDFVRPCCWKTNHLLKAMQDSSLSFFFFFTSIGQRRHAVMRLHPIGRVHHAPCDSLLPILCQI